MEHSSRAVVALIGAGLQAHRTGPELKPGDQHRLPVLFSFGRQRVPKGHPAIQRCNS